MEKRCSEYEDKKYWSFIAGGKKSAETVVDAAKREVREEVGAKFIPDDIVGLLDHKDRHGGDAWWTVTVFSGDIEGEVKQGLEPNKRESLEWFDMDNLPEPLHPTTRQALKTYSLEKLHSQL